MPQGLDLPPEILTPVTPSRERFDGRTYYATDTQALAVIHPLTGDPPDYAYFVWSKGWSPRWRVDPMKKKPDKMHWWYRLAEVSEFTGISPKFLREAIHAGRLEGHKLYGGRRSDFFVRGDMIDRFMRGLPPANEWRPPE